MIRLPKLFNRNTKPEPVGRVFVGSRSRAASKSGSTSSAYQRSSKSHSADDPALTEDPDRQRARHRLIGAAVLVLIAVVGLPRILDSKPKTISNDIAVNIVTSLPLVGAVGSSAGNTSSTAPVLSAPAASAVTPPTPAVTESAAETKSAPINPPTASAPVKNLGLAAGEEVVKPSVTTSASSATAPAAPPSTAATTPASALGNNSPSENKATGSKFVIQIGAFASEERTKGWITKLKEQKIPNYVLSKTNPDGVKLYVLRAGPFTDKEAAEVAEKKIKAMGLTPRLVEVGKT
jgi:DedD protein